MSDRIRHDGARPASLPVDENTRQSIDEPKPVALEYDADLLGIIEQALKGLQGYGIMALELIQNADDAGARQLSFDVRDDALVVQNNETFSSCGLTEPHCPWSQTGDPDGRKRPCNFHAISRIGSRSKLQAVEQTGRFGIGFVSVYQITDTPIIRSAGVELRLNPQTGKALQAKVAYATGSEFRLPWAWAESEVRAGLNASPTPPDVAKKVVEEVRQVLEGCLLFLRHLERVELYRQGELVVAVDIERGAEEVALHFSPTGVTQRWLILSRSADDVIASNKLLERFERLGTLNRSTVVNVAVPLDRERIDGLIYAYLPTRQATKMPIHFNGDFFPHASRQAIVLEGEQHERYWNQALIETAAAALSENFVRIRDLLGAVRLWDLIDAAFQRKEDAAFKPFWKKLRQAAIENASLWSAEGAWHHPNEVFLPPDTMKPPVQAAIAGLDLALIHSDLRPHWTVLSSIGSKKLTLKPIVDALEMRGERIAEAGGPGLRDLWSAVDLMIEDQFGRSAPATLLVKLRHTVFIIDTEGQTISPADARRRPSTVSAAELRRMVPNRRLAHPDVLAHPRLAELVPAYQLEDFARDLRHLIEDEDAAFSRIGEAERDVRRFYGLLTSFPVNEAAGKSAQLLSDVPFLWTGKKFVTPTRGRLPGGFHDPIGHFEIVDDRLFASEMKDLARDVLKVAVLTFSDYVEHHLEEILEMDLSRQQYGALVSEIVRHKARLDDSGILKVLAGTAFVRTRAGAYARPGECYFWSGPLASILGEDEARWVDESWIPSGMLASTRDFLEGRLGMPTTVSACHIVERIRSLAETRDLDLIDAETTPIIRHVLERWDRFDHDDRVALRGLSQIAFLCGIRDGERDAAHIFQPGAVYRAARAPGFASQVAVVEMTPLRRASSEVIGFLDLIGMPAEPPTADVVAHLEACMASKEPVHDLTYQMLSERLEDGNDVASIDRLEGTDFIHVPEVGFLGADAVFWIPPPFEGRWYAASSRMRQREKLYRRLGVVDKPGPHHYASLLLQIADENARSSQDVVVHGECLAFLSEAFQRGDEGAAEAVASLDGEMSFLNIKGDAVSSFEAIWLDSEQLADAFGGELDDRLVRMPDVSRSAAVLLLQELKIPAFSEMARFRLSEAPEGKIAEDATTLLQERAELVLWLAPDQGTRRTLRAILHDLAIHVSDRLMVQAEIAFDPPVRSPAQSAPTFLDRENSRLYVQSAKARVDWSSVFRAIFAEIERECPTVDMRPLRMTAAFIMTCGSREEAEEQLRANGFTSPGMEEEIRWGRELRDEPDTVDGFLGEDPGDFDRPRAEEPSTGESETAPISDQHGSGVSGEFGGDDRTARHGFDDDSDDTAELVSDAVDEEVEPADVDAQFSNADADGDPYGSAASRGRFGAEPGEARASSSRSAGSGKGEGARPRGEGASSSNSPDGAAKTDNTERQVRRARMLAYVARSGEREGDDAARERDDGDITELIDAAAMKAALSYERARGWTPERQSHFNPGFDIVSTSESGERRLIEVKGLENEWTERGIKLSHVQFSMAREHPDEFWIYVIEHARDLERQRVTAIGNPFGKAEEFWFDHNWRQAAEEKGSSRDINLRVGLKVKHDVWGNGTVVEIKSHGALPFVVVDFGTIEGRRGIPFNASLKLVD